MTAATLLTSLKNVSKKKLYYGLILLALCGGGVFFAKTSTTPPVAAEVIPSVTVAVAKTSDMAPSFTYSGEVRGRYESQLSFQVPGKIIKRNVQLGSIVHAGDVLLQIDAKDISQTVNSSAAQVYAAASQLKLAETNLQRHRQLYNQSAISRSQLDQYESAYEVAQASVQQATAQHRQSINQLEYSSLIADHDGIIASITAETGQIVGAGQPVITIVRNGEQEVEISVPENRIEEVRKATKITVSFWALPGIIVNGEVREIAPMAAAATRTYQARIRLLNPPPEIKLGMTAAVSLNTTATTANNSIVAIPLSAIYQQQDSPMVWVVRDSIVHGRAVQIVNLDNNRAQITGINIGETIIVSGVHKLHEGQKVRVPEGSQP